MSCKTRIVCVSDTHNASPADGAFKLPAGDVLIHAGDLTNQGTYAEIKKALDWIEAADFEVKIVIAGNHDITLDQAFYGQYGQYFHNQYPQDPQSCAELCQKYPSIRFLSHEVINVRLTKPDGPQTSFKVFGSPYSPAHGRWAFGYAWEEAEQLWSQIPLDADIVIVHTPPKYHCDETSNRGAAGCEVLRRHLWRVRPRLFVCGHVHEGRGAERVLWDLSSAHVQYKEIDTRCWLDPSRGTKKQCRIDLTARATWPLDHSNATATIGACHALEQAGDQPYEGTFGRFKCWPSKKGHQKPPHGETNANGSDCDPEGSSVPGVPDVPDMPDISGSDPAQPIYAGIGPEAGSLPDAKTLHGRLTRKETCIVNAAIKASNWSQHGGQATVYNKPIAVDIDLPL